MTLVPPGGSAPEGTGASRVTASRVTASRATEPRTTEPRATESRATESRATEPSATESSATESTATEPSATESSATESTATEPRATESTATEPRATESRATEPARPTTSATGIGGLDDLLRACALGDEEAFSQLYDATSARLFGLVLRVVRDRAQAEEVTQDVYLEIWRSSTRFDPERGSALGWMLTIAHRKAVDRVRSAEAASRRDTAYEAQDQATPYDVTVEDAHRNLDAQRVRTALSTLTETQRGALELAYFGGYTHREVAAMLGLPIGTAKTRIRDGLIRLRDTLGLER